MAIIPGVGYLIVDNVLQDCAYALIEPSVNTTLTDAVTLEGGYNTGGYNEGGYNRGEGSEQTVTVGTTIAMYVGAMLIIGFGTPNVEVTFVEAISGNTFTAFFVNSHAAGELVQGATFPVRQTTDPFFTQMEMLGYVAQAVNDFLADCPLAIAVSTAVSVPPAAQNTPLPADCMTPVRVAAYGRALRETSQSNLDAIDYRWQQQAAIGPRAYFRDKTGLQQVGIFPRANNTTPLEIVYQQRGSEVVGLADGFLLPDPFLIYVKYRVLEFAYSKDGEQRNPGLARYYNGRYSFGVKISKMFLEALSDPNLEMAQ